ncbi:MAG: choice-of-anchor V domain-containing protein [Bacteroidota bacterium]
MKLKITISVLAVVMTVFIFDALSNKVHSYVGGPPAARTGSPGNGGSTCYNGCHTGTAVTAQTGWITSNIPTQGYIGGTVYTITATATYTGRSTFGFEIACQNTSGTALGTIINTSSQTQLNGTYITHNSTGVSGTNSKTWTFNWKAPAAGTGAVTFYGAFNCANGNGNNFGDIIYTSTLAVPELAITGLDCGVTGFTAPDAINCTSTTVTPVVNVKNYGSVAITSCTINYSIDGGAPATFNWNGNLAAAAITIVTLPATALSSGLHTIQAYTSGPNGGYDTYALDDTTTFYFTTNGITPNYIQGFESTTFPPAGWSIVNPDSSTTWGQSTAGYHNGNASAHMNNYYYSSPGEKDDLISPNFNVSSTVSPQLSFYVAYAMYTSNTPETLSVFISTDCGATWTSIYSKYGTTLQTAPSTTSEFVPTASQWRKDSISLSAYTTFQNVIFKFENTTENGNDLYLDDINITASTTGIPIIANNVTNVTVFPNPTNNKLNVLFALNNQENVSIKMYDIYGEMINSFINQPLEKGNHSYRFELNDYAAGIYFLNITSGESITVKKVFVQK